MDEIERIRKESECLMHREGMAVIQMLLEMHRRDKIRVRVCVCCTVVCAVSAIASVITALL